MKVTFLRDFDFSPEALKGTSTVAYKGGQTCSVTRECADLAAKAGAIEPPKDQANDRRRPAS